MISHLTLDKVHQATMIIDNISYNLWYENGKEQIQWLIS
jgi:hypothetical protein